MSYTTALGTAGTPRHVIKRRSNGSPCFFADDDYLVYLDFLGESAEQHRCAVHAYVLMPDHVQLLVSPDAEHRLALMMRCVSGRYLEYVNYIYQRNGAFWEHGFKSTPIDGARNLIACRRVIEATPVRACLAASPADYRWSSYNHHANGCADMVIRDQPSCPGSGATRRARQPAFRDPRRRPADERAPAAIATSMSRGLVPAGERFKDPIRRLARSWRPEDWARRVTAELPPAAA